MKFNIQAVLSPQLRARLEGVVSRGVKEAEIDDNGHLIFTLTDDSVTDLGKVVGEDGEPGADGKSAYEAAQDGGYTGTEEQFNSDLADVSDKYEKPDTGIPESDLADAVKTKLNEKEIKFAVYGTTTAQTIYNWETAGYTVVAVKQVSSVGSYNEYFQCSNILRNTGGGYTQYTAIFKSATTTCRADATVGPGATGKTTWTLTNNLVTSMSAASTDTQYPSAKAVYTALQDKMDKVNPTGSGYMTIGTRDDLYEKGDTSFTVGDHCVASEQDSVAIGHYTAASGLGSLAVGGYGHASGKFSTVIGSRISGERDIEASGDCSFANGSSNLASGHYSHAEGYITTASGSISHSEGRDTVASGSMAHAEGLSTKAAKPAQHVSGIANVEDTGSIIGSHYPAALGNYIEIVGNGAIDNAGDVTKRSNARTLDWDGNERLHGDLYVGCGDDSAGGSKVATETYVAGAISGQNTFTMQIHYTDGTTKTATIKGAVS